MKFDISSIFRNTQQVAVAPQPGQPATQQQALPTPGSTMQQANPDSTTPKPAGDNNGGNVSPLDAFSKVWETDPNAKPPSDPWSQPLLQSTPDKIQAAAKTMNMLQGVDPALLQKATGGDMQSLMDVMNAVAQNTLAMSTQLSTASVERAGTVIRDRTRSELPTHMKQFQLETLPVENPVLNHPGAQGMLKVARQQIQMANPTWSAQQIQDEAVRYLDSFASAVTGNKQQAEGPQVPTDRHGQKEEDWSSFLN